MLDDELGLSFAVIGIHVDPAAVLGAEAAVWWRELGARFVHVLAPRSGPHPDPVADVTRVEDVDGAFRDWLLRRPGDCIIVLRPDRYVAAVCGRDDLDQVTDRLRFILLPDSSVPATGSGPAAAASPGSSSADRPPASRQGGSA
jgi:3-(3-hydroxy-phenyl)propionate hydroxylase